MIRNTVNNNEQDVHFETINGTNNKILHAKNHISNNFNEFLVENIHDL